MGAGAVSAGGLVGWLRMRLTHLELVIRMQVAITVTLCNPGTRYLGR